MNPIIKEHLVSGLQLFATGFLTFLGATLVQGGIIWSTSFWSAVILAAVGAGVKELFAKFAPLSFGGRVGPTLLGARKV